MSDLETQGNEALARGDFPHAAACFAEALKAAPDRAGLLAAYGATLAALGQPDQALGYLSRSLDIDPAQFPAWICSGLIHGAQGRHDQALNSFEHALALDPNHVEALRDAAAALSILGRHAEALRPVNRLIGLRAEDHDARRVRAGLYAVLQRHAEANSDYEALLTQEPSALDALAGSGIALYNLGEYEAARRRLDQALSVAPEHLPALICRALAAGKLDLHQTALADLDRALAMAPDHTDVLLNRAVALDRLQEHDEALGSLARLACLKPEDPELLRTRAVVLAHLNRRSEALADLDRALILEPDTGQARYDRALLRLALGDLEEGFREHEVRWTVSPLKDAMLKTSAPLWLGEVPLAGKTILLYHEQGLGDSIQFARYASLTAGRGARVLLLVPESLRRLMHSLRGVAAVITDREALPAHDFHCPLMSLPHAFATTLDSIPAEIPYLRADAAGTMLWRERLGLLPRPRIGLVWAGRQYLPRNPARDMRLQALSPLFDLDAQFISIQKDVPAEDVESLEARPQVLRLGESLGDFADTAALIENLDLVIAVDTSVAHLAGAMGKPVWIMNRHAACWRWLQHRADTPWYPQARLYRQPKLGDWASVVREVRADLADFVQEYAARR